MEIAILANYFLAPFLTKKCIRILVNDTIRRMSFSEKMEKIKDLLEFAKQWSLDELHKAILDLCYWKKDVKMEFIWSNIY